MKEFKQVTPLFALFLLREMDLKQYNGGVSVPSLDRKAVHRVEILIPWKKLITIFDEFASPMFVQIENLATQNEKLRAARDLLLPRLMNDRLDMSNNLQADLERLSVGQSGWRKLVASWV